MPIPPTPKPPPLLPRLDDPAAKLLPLLLLLVDLLLATLIGALPLLEPPDAFLPPFLKNWRCPRNTSPPPPPPLRLLELVSFDFSRGLEAAAAV